VYLDLVRPVAFSLFTSPVLLNLVFSTSIQRLQTRSLRGISWNNKITLHVTLLGVWGAIYNQYTITPLINLGVSTHKVHQLATKLHCHAIESLNKITKRRHKTHLNINSDNGGSDGEVTGRAAGFRRARRRLDRIAWLTTGRILINLCCFSFFPFFWWGSG